MLNPSYQKILKHSDRLSQKKGIYVLSSISEVRYAYNNTATTAPITGPIT
jgi:hypothetical protein